MGVTFEKIDWTVKKMKDVLNSLTYGEYIDETGILDTRLRIFTTQFPFGLKKVQLQSNSVHGRGVFAIKQIKKGEIITCYPADILKTMVIDKFDKEVLVTMYSTRISNISEMSEEKGWDFFAECFFPYAVGNKDENVQICGHPKFNDDSNYLGHFINDRFFCDFLKITPEIYLKLSLARKNSEFLFLDRHMVVIATQDIDVGSEIFLTYGSNYWKHNLPRQDK
jgi:hypothetical protein